MGEDSEADFGFGNWDLELSTQAHVTKVWTEGSESADWQTVAAMWQAYKNAY